MSKTQHWKLVAFTFVLLAAGPAMGQTMWTSASSGSFCMNPAGAVGILGGAVISTGPAEPFTAVPMKCPADYQLLAYPATGQFTCARDLRAPE